METLEYIRNFKIFGYAIFDLIASFGGIYLLAPRLSGLFLKINVDIPKINWVFLTLPIGIIFHLIFGSITPMTRDILDINDFYLIKILMLVLLVFGLRGIKRIK